MPRRLPDDVLPDRMVLNARPELPAAPDARTDAGEGVVFHQPPEARMALAQGQRQRGIANALRARRMQGAI